MKRILCWLFVLFLPISSWTQDSGSTLSGPSDTSGALDLSKVIDLVLAQGVDAQVLQGSFEQSKAVYDQSVAKNSISLSATGGYGLNAAVGDVSDINSTKQTYANNAVPQSFSAGVSLTGPSTTIGLSGNYNLTTRDQGDSTNSASLGVTLKQTIWDGYFGGIGSGNLEKALLDLEKAKLTQAAGIVSLKTKATQSYFDVLTAQQGLALAQATLKQRGEVLQQIQVRFNLEKASQLDLTQAEINVKSAELDQRAAENTLRDKSSALLRLMGMKPDAVLTVQDAEDPQLPSMSMADAIAAALGNRREVKQMAFDKRSADINLGLALAATSPVVSVNGGTNLSMDVDAGKAANVFSAGVSVALPLIDSGASAQAAQVARIQAANLNAQSVQLTQSISAEVATAYNDLVIKNERLGLSKLSVDYAQAQYTISQKKFELGTASGPDVLTALTALDTARSNALKAKIDAQLAVVTLQTAIGL